MEEHLDKILYLVLMLITLIAGAFSKSKKRTVQESDFPVEEYDPFPPEEEITEEYKDEFADEEKVEKNIYEAKEYVKEKIEQKKEIIQPELVKKDQEGQEDFEETVDEISKSEIKGIDYNREQTEDKGDWFDLRKAVIYSEILNRKY